MLEQRLQVAFCRTETAIDRCAEMVEAMILSGI
jgi:hypothetical protein